MEQGFKSFMHSKAHMPMEHIHQPKVNENGEFVLDENGELVLEGKWVDEAVALGDAYFNVYKIELETVYQQMLLAEFEKEALKKQGKDTNFYNVNPEDSRSVREEYLRGKLGDKYDDWCTAQRKSLYIEFLKQEKEECEKRINDLGVSIKEYEDESDYWEGESNYHNHLSLDNIRISEREKSVNASLKSLRKDLEQEKKRKQEITKKLREFGEEK